MKGALVDTCVLLDVVEADVHWLEWSLDILERSAVDGPLLINAVVYTELSIGYDTIEALEAAVRDLGLRMLEIPREALFLAGKAFLNYRKRKGTKASPLPDFFIGAHAAVTGLPLITRDTQRVSRYFPTVHLIAPG